MSMDDKLQRVMGRYAELSELLAGAEALAPQRPIGRELRLAEHAELGDE